MDSTDRKNKQAKLMCLTCKLETLVAQRRELYSKYSKVRAEEDLLRKQCEDMEYELTPIFYCPPVVDSKESKKSTRSRKNNIPNKKMDKKTIKHLLSTMTIDERKEFFATLN